MKAIIFACLLLVALASAKSAFTELEYRNQFTNWMISNNRQYENHEFNTRYNIFKANMDFVNEWNSKGSETILGLNKFADLTNKEYRMIYLKNKFNAYELLQTSTAAKLVRVSPKQAATIDWRTKGAVTEIKNQGGCGGCWSFSATGATEGAHEILTGNLVSLSEQQLIDCSGAYGNDGCGGGLMSLAFQYIIDNGGIDTEASYPFTAEQGKCKYNPQNVGATLKSYVNVTSGSESALAQALEINPVSVAIDASADSFQLYSGGIYYEPKCSQYNLDHGVLAVGYGSGSLPSDSSSGSDNWDSTSSQSQSESWTGSQSQSSGSWSSGSWTGSQSQSQSQSSGSWSSGSWTGSQSGSSWGDLKKAAASSSSSSSDSNYWIVKNSWGPDWGVNGYIYMSKDRNNNCGIATLASYPVA